MYKVDFNVNQIPTLKKRIWISGFQKIRFYDSTGPLIPTPPKTAAVGWSPLLCWVMVFLKVAKGSRSPRPQQPTVHFTFFAWLNGIRICDLCFKQKLKVTLSQPLHQGSQHSNKLVTIREVQGSCFLNLGIQHFIYLKH